jgi:hypothetical protein
MLRKFSLNKVQVEMLFNRLSQIQYSKAVDVAIARLLRRLLEVWPEMDPDSALVGTSGTIPLAERRAIEFQGDEQRAAALGLVALGEKAPAGAKLQIRREAAWMGDGIVRWYDKYLFAEKLEEFDGEWDDEQNLLETAGT